MNKQEDNNKTIEEKIDDVRKLNLPIEAERYLISTYSFNKNPNDINPLLDQYPFDLTDNKGIFVKDILFRIVHDLRQRSGLNDIFGGYVLLEEPIDSFTEIGGTSTVGMDIENIKNSIDSGKKNDFRIYCYSY
ncbi:hypothetical protein OAA83_03025 [Candidatus Marinimicrobia bacterium]|nr:hypothetical protein [Candidatus Neomarinimicrobiota bacterium]